MSEIIDDGSGRKPILDRFSASAASALEVASGSVPAKLYHFTDAYGMVGIVQRATLWATLATGLNDRSELRYGVEVLRGLLSQASSAPGAYPKFCAEVVEKLSIDQMMFPGFGAFLPFLTSFCEQENLAVQWLHYGRDGTGCALAFDGSKLAQSPLALRRVLYDPAEQRKVVESIMGTAWGAIAELSASGLLRQCEVDYLVHATASYLWETAVCMKHPSFVDEREWRLSTIETIAQMDAEPMGGTNLPMKFRVCSGRVVPYLEVAYKPLGASDPHLHDDPGLRFLLERSALNAVTIRRSDVPVRP
jgi:hypothetical protein